MSKDFERLAPECRATAKLSAEERVRLALTERWISYPRAALARIDHKPCSEPLRRMFYLASASVTHRTGRVSGPPAAFGRPSRA